MEYTLDPPVGFCLLCGNREMTCECSSIEGIVCQHCETILYDPNNEKTTLLVNYCERFCDTFSDIVDHLTETSIKNDLYNQT